jgi:AraC family transcriptional regulator of arabinose operon
MRVAVDGLDIPRLGVDTRHPAGFCIDRPRGSGDWLFLRFDTPTAIHDHAGTARHEGGVCILYAPGFRQWYRCDGNAMLAHWLHFSSPDADAAISALGIPRNACFRTTDAGAVPLHLAVIARERVGADARSAEMSALAFNMLLLSLARGAASAGTTPATAPRGDRDRLRPLFTDLCLEVQRRPERPWDLALMAREVGLSRSRFCAVFTALFGESPGGWLARQRMERAAYLLTTGMIATEVAGACGFASASHFAKMFRRRMGQAPSAYSARQRL